MSAEAIWLAVVVSSNIGLDGEQPLHYADTDADEVVEALSELGAFESDNVFRVTDATENAFTDALSSAVLRSSELEESGQSVRLLVYYTGHASAEGLHLHGDTVPLHAVKTAARVVPAEQRVFAIDACQSGTLFRTKGARLVEVDSSPPDFEPPADEAWITSSGAEEQAFEVDQRRGSLFSHFFVSGLRGAADSDDNADVTLTELFSFVEEQTVQAAARMGQRQQPRWRTDLGDLVLAHLDSAPTAVELVGPVQAPVLVVDRNSTRVVAEMPVGTGGTLHIPPGRYQLVSVGDDRWQVAELTLHTGESSRVDLAQELASVAGVRSKGGLIVTRPWRVGVGIVAMAGVAPGQAPGLGGVLRVDRQLGRGHDLGLMVGGLGGHVDTTQARIDNRRTDLAVDWTHDVAWRAIRVGPGVRVGGGWRTQRAARSSTGTWGPWFGDNAGDTMRRHGTTSALALGRVSIPLSAAELQLTGGLGAGLVFADTVEVEPIAQVTLGTAWSFR